jgi:hypothetical protein
MLYRHPGELISYAVWLYFRNCSPPSYEIPLDTVTVELPLGEG